MFSLIWYLRDASYEIEFTRLVVFIHTLEVEACLFLFFEFGEEHLCFLGIFRVFERIDHLYSFFEERSVRTIDLLADHDHLYDIYIPVLEYMVLAIVRQRTEDHHDIVAIFSR